LVWIVALLVLTASAVRWIPRAATAASLLWWQHRCMTHTPAVNAVGLEVIVASGTSKSKAPLREGWHQFADNLGATRYPPIPVECSNFLTAARVEIGVPTDALLFCHEMRTPAGEARLVMVFGCGNTMTQNQRVGNALFPMVFTPATLRQTPQVKQQMQPISDSNDQTVMELGTGFRLDEGLLDPADPTRLLIPYQVHGKAGRIEGRLGANDFLMLRVLDGPVFAGGN
jgi:hypothetical protein